MSGISSFLVVSVIEQAGLRHRVEILKTVFRGMTKCIKVPFPH